MADLAAAGGNEHARRSSGSDSMAADEFDPAGIYFGTRSGKLYASRDEGTNWRQILDRVPAITCVKAVMV